MSHTPGPWQYCGHNAERPCQCATIWSVTADAPIAKVERGEWGDEVPALRLTDDGKAEAFMERSPYGEIPIDIAEANIRLIAAAPDLLAAGSDLLECLTKVLGEPSDDPYEPRSRGADAAFRLRAAIAKATGAAS